MADKKKVDKAAGSEGIDDKDRPQGTDETDGNGANFQGQGSQKENSSRSSEGTGYTTE